MHAFSVALRQFMDAVIQDTHRMNTAKDKAYIKRNTVFKSQKKRVVHVVCCGSVIIEMWSQNMICFFSKTWNLQQYMERFAVTQCNDYLERSLGWFWKEPFVSTRSFDQYALIVFWRKLDSDAACCLSTVHADLLFGMLTGNLRLTILVSHTFCLTE